jgi:mono/diheme cytochrome c family protein
MRYSFRWQFNDHEDWRVVVKKKGKNNLGKSVACLALVIGFVSAARAQSEAEKLYKAKCAGCHAADGSANTKAGKNTGAHDFRSPDTEKETDASLIEIVTKGKKKMPKFEEKLKQKEIKELVEYVRGFSKKS